VRARTGLALAALAALCGAAQAATVRITVRIKVSDVAFTPATISVKRGDTVEWWNDDFVDHTATARNGAFEVVLRPGQRTRVLIRQARGLDYYCRYHPNMIGRLDVTE
jgi:plastocyanin